MVKIRMLTEDPHPLIVSDFTYMKSPFCALNFLLLLMVLLIVLESNQQSPVINEDELSLIQP